MLYHEEKLFSKFSLVRKINRPYDESGLSYLTIYSAISGQLWCFIIIINIIIVVIIIIIIINLFKVGLHIHIYIHIQ